MLNPSTGEFEDTHYCEDGLFVNSGDLLQQWTGDKLFAAVSNNPQTPIHIEPTRYLSLGIQH